MVGVWLSFVAAFVEGTARPSLTEMATRLGVNPQKEGVSGTAGRIAWLRKMGTPAPVLARIFDALTEMGVDPSSTRPSVLDPWLSWYAWALRNSDPITWGGSAPLGEMVDWAVATERTLAPPLTLDAASAGSRAWHRDTGASDKWDRWASRVRALVREGRRPSTGEVLVQWPDGVTLARLRPLDLQEEGEIMGHCVGSYDGAVSRGASDIYSIRNADGFPVVTLESKRIGGPGRGTTGASFAQVKGPGNSAVLPRWAPYVREAWRVANAAWLAAFEAKMAVALSEGRLKDLGIEVWRDAETGWSMLEVAPERLNDLLVWMALDERRDTQGGENKTHRVLLNPSGVPEAVLVEHRYSFSETIYPEAIFGPGAMEPSPEAKDAYLSWWVPKFRREGLRPYSPSGHFGEGHDVQMELNHDGIWRISKQRRTSSYPEYVPQTLLASSTLLWMHRGHPLFELAILQDIVSAFAFARFVDQGSMPDTVAVLEAMHPVGFPVDSLDETKTFSQYYEKDKAEWANRWFQEVDRSRSKGIVRAWAFWSTRNLEYFLHQNPNEIADPDVFAAVLRSDWVIRWIFDLEDPGASRTSLPLSATNAYLVLHEQIVASPAIRAALVANPFGALGVARWVDKGPAPDTIAGVSRLDVRGTARAASLFCERFYSKTRPDRIPASIKETLVAGGTHWEVVPYAALSYAPIRIPVRTGLEDLHYHVCRAGEQAFIDEATIRANTLGLLKMDRAPLLGYEKKAVLPAEFIAAVRAKVPTAFFRAEEIPWLGSERTRTLIVPQLALSAAQQKTKKGSARQAAREARLRTFPRTVYWPGRGFATDSRSRVFVPPAVQGAWPVSPVVHLPAVTSPAEGVRQNVDPAFLAASMEVWWARLSEAERASIRVELDLLRPALAASLEGSPEDLAAAPLDPVSGDGVPLRHIGALWVGVTPMDAMNMANTTRAVALNPQEMPILGMFPMAAHHHGYVGYVLVLPAGFGAFGPKATPTVFSSTSRV